MQQVPRILRPLDMPEQFSLFIARLEQAQRMSITVRENHCFDCLFDDDLLVTTALSEDGDFLVVSAWIAPAGALPDGAGEALLGSLLELNAWACMVGEAAFSLDEQYRIVLSCALCLTDLAADDYLHALDRLLDRARQARSLQVGIASGGVFQ